MLKKTLVGIIGGSSIGTDPFGVRSWSGTSRQVFSVLQERGALHRAFGVDVSPWREAILKLRNLHPDRGVWRRHYYMSRAYRNSLTAAIPPLLRPDDLTHDVFFIGALYDVPRVLAGSTQCYSYHDGGLASFLKSPFAPKTLSTKRIEEGLTFERQVHQGTDLIFTFSEYLRRTFISEYGINPERVITAGAGVNLDALPDARPDKDYGSKTILFIGADFRRKGGVVLLEAFRRVRESHPTATLHIVGPARPENPTPQSGGVVWHGYLSKSDPSGKAKLDSLFAQASVMVLPSLYEPFGIAPLEGMAHSIPAVVSRGWALEETVTDGENGAHVEVASVEDLADRLGSLLADPATLQRMGAAARRTVADRFTWPRVIDRVIQAIDLRQRAN